MREMEKIIEKHTQEKKTIEQEISDRFKIETQALVEDHQKQLKVTKFELFAAK